MKKILIVVPNHAALGDRGEADWALAQGAHRFLPRNEAAI